ncbi:MAG: AzlD domain-containing protein [Deltaproteobacteria bacterium]|nr:AzlD domain-containing protein [Deltaproteobacteria bacterium]
MGIVTYIPRLIPIIFLSRRELPQLLVEWLDYIPAAILSALIFPAILTSGEPRIFDVTRPDLLIAIPTFVVAFKTKSLAATVIFGMFLYWFAGRYFF